MIADAKLNGSILVFPDVPTTGAVVDAPAWRLEPCGAGTPGVRKRVYISCPLRLGDRLHNHRQADAAMAELMRAGLAPFNPALSCYAGGSIPCGTVGGLRVVAYSDHESHGEFRAFAHQDWLDVDFAWVAVSDAVLRLPGESVGADMETAFAAERGIPVFHSVEDLKAHFNGGDK